jgi:ketosteroid isomerase-like protein
MAVMSKNVELVRGLIPPAETDVAALLREDATFEQMVAALEEFIDPTVKSVAVWQGGTTHVGFEGFRQLWLDWLEPWATYYTRVEDAIDAGDRVVLLARDRGLRHDTDAEVEIIAASVWDVREGKIVRVEFFANRAQALEAAGISG